MLADKHKTLLRLFIQKGQSLFFALISLFLSLLFVTSCAPGDQTKMISEFNKNEVLIPNQTSYEKQPEKIIKKTLKPTVSLIEDNNEKPYEKPLDQIQNGEQKLIVGSTQLTEMQYTLDPENKLITITGHLDIINPQNKNIKVSQKFELSGEFKKTSNRIILKPKNKNEKIDIRAVATCFKKTNSIDEIICSSSLVDFFIKYENEYYTDQFESVIATAEKQKSEIKSDPEINLDVKTDSLAQPNLEDQNQDEVEGDDGALIGRYEGQASTIELTKLFQNESRETKEKDITNPEITVSKDQNENLILANQAIGLPEKGRLQNPSFLLTHMKFNNLNGLINISESKKHHYYGTQEMMSVLEGLARKSYHFDQNKIYVTRISAKHGGPLPPSVSHQHGMDADLTYPNTAEKTLELFKYLMQQKIAPVDRIFVDQTIIEQLCLKAIQAGKFEGSEKADYETLFQNMQHVKGHKNHFHLRLKCVPNQPQCRHKIYRKMQNCKY